MILKTNSNYNYSWKYIKEAIEDLYAKVEAIPEYTAGDNISISDAGVISATDTKYTAGDNVSISEQNVISATDTKYTAGSGIAISDQNVISATGSSGSHIYKHELSITFGDPMSSKNCKIIFYDNNSTAYTSTSLRSTYHIDDGQPTLPPIIGFITFSFKIYAVITISTDYLYYMDLTDGTVASQSYAGSFMFTDTVTEL